MADDKQVSALLRRHEQKKRWEDSETNRQATTPNIDSRKVKFQDGCVFLAACSSGDTDEVKELLKRGADINTANVDGLTALHQACIDDNLDMVEFLVDHDAYVDVCDNEGWTPLHATASCGFTEIARYLLKHGADVAAVNNDGDLAIDIAEDEEMEKLLQEEMDRKGVDADAARREEEECMLADANKWLANNCIQDNIHPKTGATALHVAAAKGYVKVMNILIQAGADINARDNDGWTPLHAAVHWGQEESVQNLVDHMCDMDAPNNAGHTVFDLADKDMLKLLEELKKKQTTIKNANENSTEIIHPFIHPGRRRSSVTRMSSDQKQNVIAKTSEEERATLEERANLTLFESTNSDDVEKKIPASIPSIQAAETERKNELNKHSPLISQSWTRPPSLSSSLDTHKPEMPKIEEVSEQEKVISVTTTITTATTTTPTPTKFPESASATTTAVVPAPSVTALVSAPTITAPLPAISMKAESGVSISLDAIPPETPIVAVSKSCGSVVEAFSVSPGKELVSRSISVPARLPTEQNTTLISTNLSNSSTTELTVPSWRRGLSKTRSTSMVHEQMNDTDTDKSLPRSASSPRLAVDNRIESLQDRINMRRPLSSTSSIPSTITTVSEPTTEPRPGDRSSWSAGQSVYSPFRNYSSRSGYMPYYQRKQEQNAKKEHDNEENKRDKLTSATTAATTVTTTINPSSSYISNTTSAPSSFALSNTTTATTTVSSPTSTSFRRSFEPPKRDEETETQRKARAKHARQTRRSTQGVDLKDIEKAEEVIRQSDPSSTKPVKDFEDTVSSRTSLPDSQKDTSSSTTIAATTTVTTVSTSLSSSSFLQSDRERERTGSNLSSRDMPKDDSSSSLRRRNWDDRVDGEIRTSFRRPREDKELASTNGTTLDITSSYVPRSQRNTPLSASDTNTTSLNVGSGLFRTASLRNRLRNGETSQEEERRREESKDTKKEESPSMDKDEKKELSAIRAKRARRERRSTGIVYDKEGEDEKGKENKPEEEEKKDSESTSSRLGRYGATDVPATTDSSSVRARPQSYTELTRSTGALDTDYKKLYEEEKDENTRLRKELDQCKKELIEAKTELDRLMRRNDTSRNTTTNDQREKRALERKVSEYEEELKKMEALKADNQRLKDENGALIRVISKLSK